MYTQTDLFNYAKSILGTPYVDFELTGAQLEGILKTSVLPIFNRYFPQSATMALDTTDDNVKTEIENEFWLREPDNLPIIGVENVLINMGDLFIHGYPLDLGFRTFDQVPGWAEEVTRGETAYLHSPMQLTFKFLPPAKIRIMPLKVATGGKFTIKYTRGHKLDLSTVEHQYFIYLRDLFMAYTKINLGNIRKKYQSLQTPFGEIPLNGDDLISQGREELDKLIDLFDNKAVPNLTIAIK